MRKAAATIDDMPELAMRWCKELGLDIHAAFASSGDEQLFPNRLVLDGSDTQWLLANRGQALDALQFLLHEAHGERDETKLAYLDIQSFRLFRMQEVKAMAAFAMQKARELGSYTFASLSPRERRWVHTVVGREADLVTESEGTGTFKALKVARKIA